VTHLRDDFLSIHAERPGYDPAESWDFWQPNFDRGEEIPVFYLGPALQAGEHAAQSNDVSALGLSMMFRLAHKSTTHDLLANADASHRNDQILDLPTLLFGLATDRQTEGLQEQSSLKGRVVFEPAVADGDPDETGPFSAVLASPKAQFYPAYVKQPVNGGRLGANCRRLNAPGRAPP
jgi:hypothetical protein